MEISSGDDSFSNLIQIVLFNHKKLNEYGFFVLTSNFYPILSANTVGVICTVT